MKKKTLKPEHGLKDDFKDIGFKASRASLITIVSLLLGVPGIGGTTNQGLDILWESPAMKRLKNWVFLIDKEIIKHGEQLEELKLENLIKNEEFISLLLQMSQLAIKTHQKEKLNTLKNSLFNSHNSDFPFDIKSSLINKLEKLTPSHLSILSFINTNSDFFFKTNDYAEILSKYEKGVNSKNIDLGQFIFLFSQLRDEDLIKIGEMTNPEAERVKVPGVWGTVSNENDDSPYLTITKLGKLILDLIKEI